MEGTNSSKLEEQLEKLSDNSVFQILLSHRPELFILYANENIDLIFFLVMLMVDNLEYLILED